MPRSKRRTAPVQWLCLVLAVSALVRLPAASAAKPGRQGGPVVTLPLEGLGFPAYPARMLLDGGTMYTLHFVDAQHLLFTFNNRKLIPRLPDAEPDDYDRNVTAELIELPTGKILATTDWRTRDREQYLWPLQHGRFLLRRRTRLSIIDPLRRSALGEEAFREEPFLDMKRRIGYISISPEGDLMAIETAPPRKPALTGGAASAAALAATEPGAADAAKAAEEAELRKKPPIQIHFYRMEVRPPEEPRAPERLLVHPAGIVLAPHLINVPATSEGFLDMKQESNAVWLFDFQPHDGKRVELSAYDTSCAPHPHFISRNEFIAFGCRGSADKVELSGFNLGGEEPWIQVFGDSHIAESLVAAPDAGRFAISRLVATSSGASLENLVPEELKTQEISVLQNYSGKILFKIDASPIQRSAQNFDLSQDGSALAVVRGGNVEVYRLPELTGKDAAELKKISAYTPARSTAQIRLGGVAVHTEAAAETVSDQPPPKKPINPADGKVVGDVAGGGAGVQAGKPDLSKEGAVVGDTPEAARKPPSLYDADHPKPQK